MWLVVFGSGALLLHRVELPARWAAALARAPQPWVPYALYFLLVALLRLAIRDSRLRPLRRKAKALAAQPAPAPLSPADFGMGVGKGVASVLVGGDFLGAVLAGLDLVVKWLGGSAVASRRRIPAAIKQAMARERRAAVTCILVVGLLCASQALEPDLLPSFTAQALALAGVGF
jgi:hypothetical protein